MVNKVFLSGYVGKDPYMPTEAVTSFNLGVTESYKSGTEWVENTNWFKVVCFGKLAKRAAEKVRKGDYLTVEGKLQTSTYEKNGQTISETKVVAISLPDAHIKRFRDTKQNQKSQDELDQALEAPTFDPDEELPF